ncbi:MAG: hypothetical protein QF406_14450 [Verrucomicrobiota bacterium]|nr:hypothetical protein [Verrucomicrobiota bacterium]
MKKLLALSAMVCACVIQSAVTEDKPAVSRSGLINSAAVDNSIKPKEFGRFAVGTIGDQKTWQSFAKKAGLPKASGVDWGKHLVLYIILQKNTNRVGFHKWIEPKKGTGELVFDWSLIEPYYPDRYPALVHVVKRADLKSVQFSFRTNGGERLQKLGTINLKPSPVKEASTRPAPLFSPGDVSVDKMELRGGLWYMKGQSKPFSGRVTLWTPGHGNEIARQVVKTYVNGKEQGSKVFRIIGKQAPRPRR